ncbi:MAG TPA: IPT/TIG domain-containing protein [Actinoplanes sp.]|nr:IPT/TIG domain-containing protein [Actinoplanes sp.]
MTVGTGAGQIQPTDVVIHGTNLLRVVAVKFGNRAGVVIGTSTATTVTVRTPAGARAGTVTVRVRTAAGGWSPVTAKSRYTFVAAPKLTRIAPTSGYYSGGTQVTLTGKNLRTTTGVTFGGQPATIVSRAAGKVVVRTPIGVEGAAAVVVTTKGGATPGRGVNFTYTTPPDVARSEVAAADGTHVAGDVEWVTGGYNETTGATDPWTVGLPKGAAVPAIGQSLLIRPGNPAFVNGLAGTVTEIVDQLDETVRVIVSPAPLESVLSGAMLDYSGAVGEPATTLGRAVGVSGKIEFPLQGSTALICRDQNGQSVSFGSDLSVAVTDIDIDQHVDLGNLARRASYDATFTAELQTTGKITVAGSSTCKPKETWVHAHRKVIPLGTTGLTVSVAPAFELVISGEGTWSVSDRTRTTFAVHATYGSPPTFSRASRSIEHTESGEANLQVTATAGVAVQFGLLDRVGVQGKVLLGITGSITAGTTPNVCIQSEIFVEFRVGLFLDVVVARWEPRDLYARITINTWRKCVAPEAPATGGEPEITSARLPDAVIDQPYSAGLSTADGRPGQWSIVDGPLPSGLTLTPDGTISGTPTGPIGDYPMVVNFTDTANLVATTTVRIRVQPRPSLGGGDIQATLRWAGAADLDLHVIDPAGEEIYFARRLSASGGQLDHDANAACNGPADDDNPVENIYWPTAAAPAGPYTVWVKVYNPCDAPLDWRLTVRRNGTTVVDETGTGDSTAYAFTLGSPGARAAATVRTVPPPAGETAAKVRSSVGR